MHRFMLVLETRDRKPPNCDVMVDLPLLSSSSPSRAQRTVQLIHELRGIEPRRRQPRHRMELAHHPLFFDGCMPRYARPVSAEYSRPNV